jgi:ribonuclease III
MNWLNHWFPVLRKPTPIEIRIGYKFKSKDILTKALMHRAGAFQKGLKRSESNERLEFLGDAIISFLVSEHLFNEHPSKREGELTEMKGVLVSRAHLAFCAERIGLWSAMSLGKTELDSRGKGKSTIMSDAFEALVGAIYLDGGIKKTRVFIIDNIIRDPAQARKDVGLINYKSCLQEEIQARWRIAPRYRVVNETGPDHAKFFSIEVTANGVILGNGNGPSKKHAEQNAAHDALDKMKLQHPH